MLEPKVVEDGDNESNCKVFFNFTFLFKLQMICLLLNEALQQMVLIEHSVCMGVCRKYSKW